jgi:DNA-binding NtrC family response regulator
MSKLVVVDDEASVRLLYLEELAEEGYEVTTVGTCEEALPHISFVQPSAVILDIRMDDCDGLDLLQELRIKHPKLPIILNTAYDSYREDLKSVADDEYFVKSYDLSKLKETLSILLRGVEDYG